MPPSIAFDLCRGHETRLDELDASAARTTGAVELQSERLDQVQNSIDRIGAVVDRMSVRVEDLHISNAAYGERLALLLEERQEAKACARDLSKEKRELAIKIGLPLVAAVGGALAGHSWLGQFFSGLLH
jgi:multidrug resistance efflux pump